MKPSTAAALALAASLGTTAHALDGAWTAMQDEERPDRIYLSLTRGRTNQMGTTLPAGAFVGLTPSQIVAATETAVRFELRREAGDTTLEGSFRDGKGSGHFSFVARPAFLGDVRALGVSVGRSQLVKDQEEQLFTLAMCDVTIAYIRSMIAEGYRVTLDEYLSMRIFDVTPEYIREMRSLGFNNISQNDLVATKIHGVSPDYIREMRAQGWDLSLDDYQANRIFDVTPQFAEQMKQLGYDGLSRDDLVAFRIHGVTREYIHEMRDLGYADLSAGDLVSGRIHGITPDFIREVAEAGYVKVPFDKLVALRLSGIDAKVLERMRSY